MTALPMHDCAAAGGDVAAVVETLRRDQTGAPLGSAWPPGIVCFLRPGSSGVVILVSGYEPFFPRVGTSSSVVDQRPRVWQAAATGRPTSSVYRQTLAMTIPDQMCEILAALSLNKSQLAAVLGVTRPTLYDWFEGKEPNPANAERLTTLLRLLARAQISSAAPLNARFVRRPIDERGPSLLDELAAATLHEERIEHLLREARGLGEAAATRRRSREERLRALGYEEPSDEQRRQQLNRNVASLDWPNR